MTEQSPKEPSAFKQEWEAKKLLKKSKKKAAPVALPATPAPLI